MIARYYEAVVTRYFGRNDAEHDSARSFAEKFLERSRVLTKCGQGWDYAYARWYQRVLGLAEEG
jgi:hypothetical protein